MYRACPQALEERLSGQRTLLHYIVSEGASSEVVSFVISKVPSILVSFVAAVLLLIPDDGCDWDRLRLPSNILSMTRLRAAIVHSSKSRTHSR